MASTQQHIADRSYVTEIWCPPTDNGVHALSSRMPEPEPLPEPEPEAELLTSPEPRIEAAFFAAEPEPEAAEPEAERLTDTAADLGHDYAEYQAWAVPEPEPEAEP